MAIMRPKINPDDYSMMTGLLWTREELEKMKMAGPVPGFQLNRIKQPGISAPLPTALFPPDADVMTSYDYSLQHWKSVVENGERARFTNDAIAHRLEAQRRMVVCRLDGGRHLEVEYWHEWVWRFTKNFYLPELKDGDS
jgi:hypothetical protein